MFSVQRCLSENLVSQVLPLHHTGDLNRLKRDWVLAFLKLQPLGKGRAPLPLLASQPPGPPQMTSAATLG